MKTTSQSTTGPESAARAEEVQSGWRVTLSTAMKNNLDEVLSSSEASQIANNLSLFSKRLELFNANLIKLGIIVKGRTLDKEGADQTEKMLLENGLLVQAKDLLGGAVLKTRVQGSTPREEKQQLEGATLKDYVFTHILNVQSRINTAINEGIAPKFAGLNDTLINLLKEVQDGEDYKLNEDSKTISESLRDSDMEHRDVDCTPEGINKAHLSILDLQIKLSRIEKFYERAVNAYEKLGNELIPKSTKSDYDNRAKMQETYKDAFLGFYKEVAYFITPETMYEAVDVVRDLFNIEIFVVELGNEYKRLTAIQKA